MGSKKTYWLNSTGVLSRKDNTLLWDPHEGKVTRLPIETVNDFVSLKYIQVDTPVLGLLGKYNIDLHILGWNDNYVGSFLSPERYRSGVVTVSQVQAFCDEVSGLELAKKILDAAAFNSVVVLGRDENVKQAYQHVFKPSLKAAENIAAAMGAEGTFRKYALKAVDEKIKNPDFHLGGRHYRPTLNYGNALLSYLNAILYVRILDAIRLTPLKSDVGFLHAVSHSKRHTLALDISEVFKPLFADRILLRLVNRGEIKSSFFREDNGVVLLSDTGRAKIIEVIKAELEVTVTHPQLKRKVTYATLFRLEAYKLLHYCTEGEVYKPFRIWW